MAFIFHFIYGIILPIDFHMFQDGLNHQPDNVRCVCDGKFNRQPRIRRNNGGLMKDQCMAI